MVEIVEKFCTPPVIPLTDFDTKALAEATKISIPFEKEKLQCYVQGEGKTIILAHGWGSRASHMSFIGRALATSGFKVVMFDAPAHSSIGNPDLKTKSNMFEFCRALHTIIKNFEPVFGVIGHSLGAISTVFTAAGYKALSNYKISADKFVLVSLPGCVDLLLHQFCKLHGLNDENYHELKINLEKEFNFSVDEYSVPLAVNTIVGNILFIHDEEDEQMPIENVFHIKDALPASEILITKGYGHDKILMNRQMIRSVVEFMKE